MNQNKEDFTPGRPLRLYREDGTHTDMSTDSLVGDELNFFKGWTCGLGKENVFIDMDGYIYGASCRVGGCYGNIYEGFEIPKSWTNCPKDLCSCGADLFIPKAKNEESKNRLEKTFPQNLSSTRSIKSQWSEESESGVVALERTHDSNLKQVYWEIGRRCNYDCSYCWPWIHSATEAHKSFETLINATMMVDEKFCAGDTAHFVISGGEPTINPAFFDWVLFIKSLGHKISMHSNGSRLPEYYKDLIHHTNLNLSVHLEFYKKERFLKVVESVVEEKVKADGLGHLEVKIMMKPGTREESLQLESELLAIENFKNYCMLAMVPIRDGKKGDLLADGYTEKDFELFGERF